MAAYIDAMTLAAVADEWRTLLRRARIDTIIQPTEHALALQCYTPGGEEQGGKNRWLYLSAHPQLARAHITALKPTKIAIEPPPFVMLLRKHLEGARIESIGQPRWERVLEIVAGYRVSAESDEVVRFRLIIELMGRLSNIILCNADGLILGSLKRVGADVNRYRTVAAGVPYVPPPPQQRMLAGRALPRLEPTTVTGAQLAMSAAERDEQADEAPTKKRKRTNERATVWQLLTRQVMGCSSLLAHEAIARATEDGEFPLEQMNEALWEEVAWNLRDLAALYDTHRWQPRLVERRTNSEAVDGPITETQRGQPIAFAPYPLEQYEQDSDIIVRQSPSINVVLDEYYARTEWHDALESLRAPLRRLLQTQRERCVRKADLLNGQMEASGEADSYRFYGELLLAHQHEVTQGQTSIALQNIFEADADGQAPEVVVPLDPRFDAVTNANRFFNRYHKLRRGLELIPAQIEQNEVELATVEQLQADLALAENAAEVAHVRAEVQAAGYLRGKAALDKKALKAAKKGKGGKQAKGKQAAPSGGVPIHVQSREGFTMLVGKNSRQNEDVTFRLATTNDMWLHARGVAGAHVIVKAAGRDIPKSTIEQAASLAAYYSGARGSTSTPVDYTLQRHVRHMKGGGPGMVIYDHERTLYIEPDKAHALLSKA